MKKIIIIIYILLISLFPKVIAFATQGYARITTSYSYLYKSASSEIQDNIICYLEETYFVYITLDYNEDFYKVTYKDIDGYVMKSNVSRVLGSPSQAYPATSMTTINNKCYLRSSPKITEDNIITVVPQNCSDLEYIGKIYGEEAIDYQGNLWYFVSFYGVNGYIYHKYVDNIKSIAINIETMEQYANNLNKNPTPLNNLECGIIIAILSFPIIFIILIMYKSPKAKPLPTNKTKSRKLPKPTKIDYDNLL